MQAYFSLHYASMHINIDKKVNRSISNLQAHDVERTGHNEAQHNSTIVKKQRPCLLARVVTLLDMLLAQHERKRMIDGKYGERGQLATTFPLCCHHASIYSPSGGV
jgi:hypothetical protein